jgi:peroxiredoxin
MIRMMALLQNFWKIVVPVLQKNFTDLIKQVGIAATWAVGLQSYTVQDIYQNSWMFRLEPVLRNPWATLQRAAVSIILILAVYQSSQTRLGAVEPQSLKGIKAPEFRLSGSDGQSHRLSKTLESGPVIVVWFPKAYTGNVELMLKSIEKSVTALHGKGVKVFAASCDKTKYLSPFSKELGLSFPILADPTRTTAIQWAAVHDGRDIPERWAYFIGRDGRIAAVVSELEAARAGEILVQESLKLGW